MNHQTVLKLYPQVVNIINNDAFDKDGNQVEIDINLVNSWIDPNAYKYKRAAEYPSFADQFDLLYHGGYDAWKTAIEAVKKKYPKGTE